MRHTFQAGRHSYDLQQVVNGFVLALETLYFTLELLDGLELDVKNFTVLGNEFQEVVEERHLVQLEHL